jgi:hypothetical protein
VHIEPRKRAKLARIVRYGGIALVAAWSLLALAAYAATSALSGWLRQMLVADGWIAWSGHLLGQAGGTTIFVVWLAGSLAALALMPLLRRLVA